MFRPDVTFDIMKNVETLYSRVLNFFSFKISYQKKSSERVERYINLKPFQSRLEHKKSRKFFPFRVSEQASSERAGLKNSNLLG